jgi:ferredoxin-type protein NapF
VASRRDFFRSLTAPMGGIPSSEEVPLAVRPPYGLDESLFQSGCLACEHHACVTSCEEKIIVLDERKIPTLDFSRNGCTFCEACAQACDHEVLSLERSGAEEWINAMFRIHPDACIAHQGVICFACKEPCMEDAILFNGMFNPVIDENRCNGCGFCLGRCPTRAIDYTVLPWPTDETDRAQ